MTRRSCASELETLQGTIEEVAPAMPGPLYLPGFAQSLGRLELALGRDAISLAHHGEAHALAGIRAGARRLTALTGALALTGVCTHAMAIGGLCIGRYGHASHEQGGSSCGDGGAGFGSNLHDHSPNKV